MEIPVSVIAEFPPSSDLLVNHARSRTDDEMLKTIAQADYGIMADVILPKLYSIRDTGMVPMEMSFPLKEVLNLTRNCDPDAFASPQFNPGPKGRRGHQTRLFACAVLLRTYSDPGDDEYDVDLDSTLAQCLVSARCLGAETNEAVARFLTWRYIHQASCSDASLFLALSLLILATRLRIGVMPALTLGSIADWVLAHESQLYTDTLPIRSHSSRPRPFSVQAGLWKPIATELRDQLHAINEIGVRETLMLCCRIIE